MSDYVRLECPTGLVLALYPEWWYKEKQVFANYEEYCQDLWDSNVYSILEPGPYTDEEMRGLATDMMQLQSRDWLCFLDYLKDNYEKAEAARRRTLRYKYEKVREYGQRAFLAGVALGSHVAEGAAAGVEAAVLALRTNQTKVPAVPWQWHVQRIKNAWKGQA